MSWTVAEDEGVLNVRAVISDPKELQELIESLQRHQEQLKEEKKDV